MLQYRRNEDWQTLYTFTTEEYFAVDYEMMNYFVSHSPDSIFTQSRICVIPTPEAWVILNNQVLKIRSLKDSIEIQLHNDADYRDVLASYFSIEFPLVHYA